MEDKYNSSEKRIIQNIEINEKRLKANRTVFCKQKIC